MDKNYKIIIRETEGNKNFDEISLDDLFNKLNSRVSFDFTFSDFGETSPTIRQENPEYSILQMKYPTNYYFIDEYKIPSDFYGTVVIIYLDRLNVERYNYSNITEYLNNDYVAISTGINYNERSNKLYLYFKKTFSFKGRININ